MNRKEQLVVYIRANVDPQFNAESDPLIAILDSVSLMQLILFIEQDFGITLDLATLGIDMFATVETVVATLEELEPSGRA
jgi:acyl carrier protein